MTGPAIRYVFRIANAAAMESAKAAVASGTVWGCPVAGAEARGAVATMKGQQVHLVALALPLGTAVQRTRARAFDASIQRPTVYVDVIASGEEVWAAPVSPMAAIVADPSPATAI